VNNLWAGTGGDCEVILVIDSDTLDERAEILGYLGEKLVVHIVGSNKGPAHARNTAAKLASTDWLVFVDSDVVVPESVFARLVRKKSGTTILPAVLPIDGATKSARYFSDGPLAPKLIGGQVLGVSACFGISKMDYFLVDGFDERYKSAAGEDWDFFRRLQRAGVMVHFDNRSLVFHHNPTNLISLLMRSYRYARHGGSFGENVVQDHWALAGENLPPLRAIMAIVKLLFLGSTKVVSGTLSVGSDWFNKVALGAHDKILTSNSGTQSERAKARIPSRFQLGPFVGKLRNTLLNYPAEGPWHSVLSVRADLKERDYRSYRFLVVMWRLVFIFGSMQRKKFMQ
jgi:hypothetical protein